MCFYCKTDYLDSSQLKEHCHTEHQDPKLHNVLKNISQSARVKIDISEMSCKRCLNPIKDVKDFIKHFSEAHDVRIVGDTDFIYSFKLSDYDLSCVDCGQKFKFFGILLRHVHKHHVQTSQYLCEICGQAFVARANVDSHIKYVHSYTSSPCKLCGEVFQSAYAMKTHTVKVHSVGSLKCPKCPAVLGSRYLKKAHLATVHDVKSMQFSCNQCPKVFTEKSKLLHHTLRVHLKEKLVECEICGFKVYNQDLLKRHVVRHNDERPFECQYCKKTFQRKKTLTYHVRIHTDDRRHVCKECGKAFVQVTSLKSHLRSHHSKLSAVDEGAL